MFQLETPFLELVIRGAFLYVLFLVLFRILPRRTASEMSPMDLVFLLLITEAASHALGDFSSLTDGTVQILTMVVLNWAINKLSFHVRWIERLVEHGPLVVIRDGKTIPDHLRREALTDEELKAHLRLEGLESVDQVKVAHLEGDGRLSVVKADSSSDQGGQQPGVVA